MKLKVLGSSSSGNCYLLENKDEILILEAGIAYKKVLQEINFNYRAIKGVVTSHSHGDHSGCLKEFTANGILTLCTKDTIARQKLQYYNVTPIEDGASYQLGNFKISVFAVKHDVECYGFYIQHEEMGSLVFATDTQYIEWVFNDVNHIMVEANYAMDILDENVYLGRIPRMLRDRIMKSHTSFDTAKNMVKANLNKELRNVIMIHLSDGNSDEKRFVDEMKKIVSGNPYSGVCAARKGTVVDLSLVPF